MAAKQQDPAVAWETWTPAQAENALMKNEVNRQIRETKVEQYARDMLAGNWTNTGDPIKFNAEGKLADGQHRLHAQIKADVKKRWLVVREVPVEAQVNMDMNIPRSIGDILHFQGERAAQLLTAVTRMVHLITTTKLSRGRYGISVSEIMNTLEAHPDVRLSTEMAAWANKRSMTPIAPSVLGAAHWMIMQKAGREDADQFIARVATLVGEEEGSPVLALNSRANEIKRLGQRVNQRDKLNLVIKAWNYDAEGKTVRKMSLYPKNHTPRDWKLFEVKERKVPQRGLEDPGDDDGDE